MPDNLLLEVETREAKGKNVNRRLRASGRIPAVVYGAHRDTIPITVDRKKFHDLLRHSEGENMIFLLKRSESGQERHAMIREMQVDPVERKILHIDFLRVLMDEAIRVMVPVEAIGVPLGVKNEGGVLDFVTREVEIECLPGDIPHHLAVDVSELHVNQHVEAGDLELPEGVILHEELDRVIVSVSYPDIIEEPEEDEEGVLLEAEAEEPELIGREEESDEEAEEEG